MKKLISTLIGHSLLLFPCLILATNSDLSLRVVTTLDYVEPWKGHLFHLGALWVGRSGNETKRNWVEIFDSEGKVKLKEIVLPHSPIFIRPFGSNAVLVFGKSASPWKSHYTVIERRGTHFSASSTTMPENNFGDDFGGDPQKMFFSDAGDAKLFRWSPQSKTARYLAPTIRLPGKMLLWHNHLFVIEQNTFDWGDENLVRIDLRTEMAERTFTDVYRVALTDLLELPNSHQLAVTEMGADQVLFIDPQNNRLEQTLRVPGGQPRALALMGNCLVVASDETRQVQFFDLSRKDKPLISNWDLSVVGNKLRKAHALAVDDATGRVYVRSSYVCPSSLCDEPMSSVVVAEEKSQKTFRACAP